MRRWFGDFYSNEEGQALVEYTLVLSVMISIALFVVRTFIKPIYTKVLSIISRRIENEFFGANLHVFRVRR